MPALGRKASAVSMPIVRTFLAILIGLVGRYAARNRRRCCHLETCAHVDARSWRRTVQQRNLRFKTDVSGDGPETGAPALVSAGMMGDRADVIFADPSETSTLMAGNLQTMIVTAFAAICLILPKSVPARIAPRQRFPDHDFRHAFAADR